MLDRAPALLDPVIHFFKKQSSIVSSLNDSRPSCIKTGTFIGKASALLWSEKNHDIHVEICWTQVKKSRNK